MTTRKLRMGMAGGGRDAYMGPAHRMAAQMDGQIELVCGAFSSSRRKSIESGRDLHLPHDRVYATYRDLFRKEAKLPDSERMDFVSIVTPNNMHYPVSMAALDGGFHVVCDVPMTITMDEAVNLEKKVRQVRRLFCLTHTHAGHPTIREARDIVRHGKLGKIRRVVVEYPRGWLATRMETSGQKQAVWRTDPRRAGQSFCMSDLGTHCEALVEYLVDSPIEEVCADLTTFVPGRPLDDDASVLLRFKNGARGVLWASEIAIGEEDGLAIRIYGDKGSLYWRRAEPDALVMHGLHKPTEIRRATAPFVIRSAAEGAACPAGSPQGLVEALANVYSRFADAVREVLAGAEADKCTVDFPTVRDGVRGMAFLDAVVASAKASDKWVAVSEASHESQHTTLKEGGSRWADR